jgi:hypothetical protein
LWFCKFSRGICCAKLTPRKQRGENIRPARPEGVWRGRAFAERAFRLVFLFNPMVSSRRRRAAVPLCHSAVFAMRAVFTALLLASSASADYILQQTWADDACRTSVSVSTAYLPTGPADASGCAAAGGGNPFSSRVVCTPSGPGLYNIVSYAGTVCAGTPIGTSSQGRGGCDGQGSSESCVAGSGGVPAGPTSGAVVTKRFSSEKSCPLPSSAVEDSVTTSAFSQRAIVGAGAARHTSFKPLLNHATPSPNPPPQFRRTPV